MTEKLLDEYVKITMAIENVQNKINQYKKKVENIINNTESNQEKRIYIEEFKTVMMKIKNDNEITKKYRTLRKRQNELKKIFLEDSKPKDDKMSASLSPWPEDTDITLCELKKKYELKSKGDDIFDDESNYDRNTQITEKTKQTIQNIKYYMILQEIRKNLNRTELNRTELN